MLIDLNKKVVIVTGAAGGIGANIAATLADEGATTIALDLTEAALSETGARIADAQGGGAIYAGDVRDASRVNEIVADVLARFGRIDVLVNNAGVAGNGLVEELDDESWDRVFDVNMKGVFHTCQAVIPAMKAQRSGRIINSSSFAAIVPLVGGALYAASKSAVTQFTRALAGELGPWNVTVNAYAPGMIPTALGRFGEMSAERQERYLDSLTLRRWGEPSEISELVCFLASDLAQYITGTLIDVSGGKLATQQPRMAYEQAAASGDYTF
ncbi:SDR family NAD(P)-dependent oxidoreductase [Compostimonas suwonensis]|uniref:3-oxoacyl-[acyl-carrier protein] reductase n=1 Tax=Compostimonas suwonensis TaxID=1048394 RepID=A0A2M9C371_9MICO|nr:SDR family NAD(P)-dependent oxidoreductase [Compostimonas suwonensis]PJJ65001.1 3-oxoacyl-[acyl-carrier protein] reductase [Compostimonas suwonensis]